MVFEVCSVPSATPKATTYRLQTADLGGFHACVPGLLWRGEQRENRSRQCRHSTSSLATGGNAATKIGPESGANGGGMGLKRRGLGRKSPGSEGGGRRQGQMGLRPAGGLEKWTPVVGEVGSKFNRLGRRRHQKRRERWNCFADRYDVNLSVKKVFCTRENVENWFESRGANLISRSRWDCGWL